MRFFRYYVFYFIKKMVFFGYFRGRFGFKIYYVFCQGDFFFIIIVLFFCLLEKKNLNGWVGKGEVELIESSNGKLVYEVEQRN